MRIDRVGQLAAGVYLEECLSYHTPYAAALPDGRDPTEKEVVAALTRQGKPSLGKQELQDLLHELGGAGYGWLRREEVRRQLELLAASRAGVVKPAPGA